MKKLLLILLLFAGCKKDDDNNPDSWAGNYRLVSAISSDSHYEAGGCDIAISNNSSFSISATCLSAYVNDVIIVPIDGNQGTIHGFQIMDHWTLNSGSFTRSGDKLTAEYSITVRNTDGSIHGNPHFTNTYQRQK